jgi:hypothetical protein
LRDNVVAPWSRLPIIASPRTGASWHATDHREGAVSLALGCELPIDAIYRDPLA